METESLIAKIKVLFVTQRRLRRALVKISKLREKDYPVDEPFDIADEALRYGLEWRQDDYC